MSGTMVSGLAYQEQGLLAPRAEEHSSRTASRTSPAREDEWTAGLAELIGLYRDIERRSLALPAFSITPALVYSWNVIKFTFCLYGDLLLLIPLNVVIFVRNLLPGRWRYRSFSGKYFKYVAGWIWNGEMYMASIHIRWLAKYLLTLHFRRRLNLLRRQILLAEMTEDRREDLLSRTDRALEAWPSFDALAFTFTYGLPVFGWALNAAQDFYGFELSKVLNIVSIALIPYVLMVVGSAFFIKRGLMLGGRGPGAYYAGALAGAGGYGDEARILRALGVRARECAFDAVILLLGFGPSVYSQTLFQPAHVAIDYGSLVTVYSVMLGLTIGLMTIALWRRRRLGRG